MGKTPFAAVNFIMQVLMILVSLGFMFGSGGSALVSKTMGEGEPEKARKLFSLFIYSTVVCGVIIAVISFLFICPLVAVMWAEGEMLDHCVLGIDGIWFSVVAAELVAAVMTVLLIAAKRGKYQY